MGTQDAITAFEQATVGVEPTHGHRSCTEGNRHKEVGYSNQLPAVASDAHPLPGVPQL